MLTKQDYSPKKFQIALSIYKKNKIKTNMSLYKNTYAILKKKKNISTIIGKKKKTVVNPHFSHTNNFKLLPNKFKSPHYHSYVFL